MCACMYECGPGVQSSGVVLDLVVFFHYVNPRDRIQDSGVPREAPLPAEPSCQAM